MTSQCGKYTIWTNPADIDYLKNQETGEITQPKICAEWTLSNAYTQTMPGKEGLLIGKKGMHLKNLQERMNSVNGEGSVNAIWATKNSENRTVFSVLGNNLDAVVCSAHEVKIVKKFFKKEIITPGIRFNTKADDQKRVLTPKQAYKNGSDWLVIGRPITKGNIKKNIQSLVDHLSK